MLTEQTGYTTRTPPGPVVRGVASLRADFAVKVFDILYLNGHCLTGKRLSERKTLLKNHIFKDLDMFRGRIELVNEEEGRTGKDIRNMLERILEQK